MPFAQKTRWTHGIGFIRDSVTHTGLPVEVTGLRYNRSSTDVVRITTVWLALIEATMEQRRLVHTFARVLCTFFSLVEMTPHLHPLSFHHFRSEPFFFTINEAKGRNKELESNLNELHNFTQGFVPDLIQVLVEVVLHLRSFRTYPLSTHLPSQRNIPRNLIHLSTPLVRSVLHAEIGQKW